MKTELFERYLTDKEGNKIAVVLDIETYQQLLEQLNQFNNII
jgi:nitrate reductase NapAB chaperone NapD